MMSEVKIHIVEDEIVIAHSTRNKLKKLGYTVTGITATAERALTIIKKMKPNLILMDIKLKGVMDGIEAAHDIHNNLDIPIVFLTAYADEKTIHRVKFTEPYGYLIKPFEIQELQSAIELALYKHRVSKKLKESEKRHRIISELISDFAFAMTIDPDTKVHFDWVTEAFTRITGYSLNEINDMKISKLEEIFCTDHLVQANNILKWLKFRQNFTKEVQIMNKGGQICWLDVTCKPILLQNDNKKYRMIGAVKDITKRKLVEIERKKTQEELEKSRKQLQALAAHLQTIREEERSYISREIHDELGQVLTAIKMDLSLIAQESKSNKQIDKTNLLNEIANMQKIIDITINKTRELVKRLRPEVLDNINLIDALEWQIYEFKKRTKIACRFTKNIQSINIDKDRAVAIFRVVQETLTNITRHAKAKSVKADIAFRNHQFLIRISDNGIGIPKEKLSDMESFGIMGMKERIAFCNGNIEIKTPEGKGTEIQIQIPIREAS